MDGFIEPGIRPISSTSFQWKQFDWSSQTQYLPHYCGRTNLIFCSEAYLITIQSVSQPAGGESVANRKWNGDILANPFSQQHDFMTF